MVFWQRKPMGGACVQAAQEVGLVGVGRRMLQTELEMEPEPRMDLLHDVDCRRGMTFNTNSSLACNKASFRLSLSSPKRPIKQFVAHQKFIMQSCKSNMTVEHFVYKNVYYKVI